MRPLKFVFDDQVVRDGFTDDTYWNGFINVWVTLELHKELNEIMGPMPVDDPETAAQFVPDASGYVPYGGGAVICTEVYQSPEEFLGLKITD